MASIVGDPFDVAGDPGVDPGEVGAGAAGAPRHHAALGVGTHQWTAGVALEH